MSINYIQHPKMTISSCRCYLLMLKNTKSLIKKIHTEYISETKIDPSRLDTNHVGAYTASPYQLEYLRNRRLIFPRRGLDIARRENRQQALIHIPIDKHLKGVDPPICEIQQGVKKPISGHVRRRHECHCHQRGE